RRAAAARKSWQSRSRTGRCGIWASWLDAAQAPGIGRGKNSGRRADAVSSYRIPRFMYPLTALRTPMIKRSLLLSLLLVAGGLHAQDQAPDMDRAKQLAESICAGCHAVDGNSTIADN